MKRQREVSSDSEDEDKGMQCTVCNKHFETSTYLKQHMQIHQKKKRCAQCEQEFSFKANLDRHVKKVHGALLAERKLFTLFTCDICDKTCGRKYHLVRHRALVHQKVTPNQQVTPHQRSTTFPCVHCDKVFLNYETLIDHVEQVHPFNQQGGRQPERARALRENDIVDRDVHKPTHSVENKQSNSETLRTHNDQIALQANVQNRNIVPRQNERYDVLTFFANVKEEVMTFLRSRVRQLRGIKWNLCVQVEMQREDVDESRTASPYFRSNTYVSLSLEDMNEHDLNEAFQKMFASLEKYMRDGSGWFIKKVLKLDIHTVVYRPISGSGYIPLPSTLALSNSLLNIQNQDEKCFLYCILASLHPVQQHPECVTHYRPYEHDLDMSGIHYPVTLPQIHKFECHNENISINVFTFEKKSILPLRVTTYTNRLHHVNLLWLKTQDASHYCLITNLNRFLSRTKTHRCQQYFCPYCLHAFKREELLINHRPNCSTHGPQKVELPSEKENILKFKEYEKTLKVPFVIYADFETVNRKLHTCTPNPEHSALTPITKLEVCSFGYKVICEAERFTKPSVIYRGADAANKLIESLLQEREQIETILSNIEPLNMSKEQQHLFDHATQCCLCKKTFSLYDKIYKRIVRHHNHLTGEFVGAACNDCNLKCKQAKFTPVLFHNLKNFDAHILCETLGRFKNQKLRCIAQNSERYVSFSLGELRFLDSFQFLPSSLETLVDDLKQDGLDAFQHVLSEIQSRDQAELLVRKGFFPYSYIDRFDRFDETHLPPLDAFYSSIKKESISEENYAHAEKVFLEFNMTTLGEYHDWYLKMDVLLLCDVFESFRKTSLSHYELDPCHFFTSPGLSWTSLLKMSGAQLELITDIDQMLLFETGLRGGFSQISHRYKRANNPYLEDYDSNLPTSYLQNLDANNLYGWAMTQSLPVGDFQFLNNIDGFDVMAISENGEIGYILDVSLHYPRHLHDLHNCLPLAPEHKQISNENLSPYAKRLLRKLHHLNDTDPLPTRGKVDKLLTTLEDKDHYVLHYRNLQLYVKLGMEIKAIHKVLQFRQETWMKPYIDYNTQRRKQATSTFQKNFYKLMNVSVFGKTIENVRKYKNIHLINRKEQLRKLTAKPTYKTSTIFKEDLVAVELLRSQVKLCKPSYCGMCILDLSKCVMYDFWYNNIKKRYGNTAQLQITDTDSLLFYCETEDIYEDMRSSMDAFDTSDYPPDHPLHSNRNCKTLAKMKDQDNSCPISEFIGLKSKQYSYVCNKKEEKRAKGIAKVTVKKDLRHQHYKDTLFGETSKVSSMTMLRSHRHELFCETIQKTGLSAFDDKRYLVNSIDSLAYGHYRIKDSVERESCARDNTVHTLPAYELIEDDFHPSLEGQTFESVQNQSFVLGDFKITACSRH